MGYVMTHNELLQAAILRCELSKPPAGVSADAFLITTFNYLMYTNSVKRPSETEFDRMIRDGVKGFKGKLMRASDIYQVVTENPCNSSNAKLTGLALKRLGYQSVRHGGKILWIL